MEKCWRFSRHLLLNLFWKGVFCSSALWALSSHGSLYRFLSALDLAKKVSYPCVVDLQISPLSLTYMQAWYHEKRQIATHPPPQLSNFYGIFFIGQFWQSRFFKVGESPFHHLTADFCSWVGSSAWQNLLIEMSVHISGTQELYSSIFKPPP